MRTESANNVIVLVVGDIGRSPRMCYHALSLANHGFNVNLIGYIDSAPHKEISSHPRIKLVAIQPSPDFFSLIWRPFRLGLKFIWLLFTIFYTLMFKTHNAASILLVQNPPGVPTLAICCFAAWMKSSAFIIDWHNYTFSMLKANYTQSTNNSTVARIRLIILSGLLQFVSWWEGFWGRYAHYNLCVSQVMRRDLISRWNLHPITLYDKAPSWIFRPMCSEERHYFLIKLLNYKEFKPVIKCLEENAGNTSNEGGDSTETSIFSTRNEAGLVQFRQTRPLLIVSSTSWTPDEDFNILFDALKDYERYAQANSDVNAEMELPNILVAITGKGPMRAEFASKFAKFKGPKVQVILIWLAAEDYPKILASADIGISLHTSASGLDLPMKVVDMFGCHLPVLAKRFEAIGELVAEDLTGALFDTSQDLKRLLIELFAGFPTHNNKLKKLREYFGSHLQAHSWEQQWDATVFPLVTDCARKHAAPTEQELRWWRYCDVHGEAKKDDLSNSAPK